MRSEEFIRRCFDEWAEFANPALLARAPHPSDRSLAPIVAEIPGTTSENKLKLVNLAVGCLSDGEVYVEVGSFKGATLIAAAQGNPSARIYGCDHFSRFEKIADSLARAVKKRFPEGQITMFDANFRDLLDTAPWEPRMRIGVFHYDARHTFRDQYEAMVKVLPRLSSEALVIIDDANRSAVRAAASLFAQEAGGFETVLALRTPRDHSPTWWNGLLVYRYRKQRGVTPEFYGNAYALRKIIHDDILGRFRRSHSRHRAPRSSARGAGSRVPVLDLRQYQPEKQVTPDDHDRTDS